MKNQTFKRLLNNPLKKPYLVGKRGEGKTQYVKDYCKTEVHSLFILNMAAIEASDFCGLPYIENGKTKYARPHFFDYDFLFLDEVDRVQNGEVLTALLSLLQDAKINGHDYRGLICGAGNGSTDSGTVEFPDALQDRFQPYQFSYSVQEKINYLSAKHGLENNFIKYVKTKASIFESVSTRSIDYYASFADDNEIMKLVLSPDLFRHYEQFTFGLVLSLQELISSDNDLALAKKVSALTSMTKISLSLDVASQLEMISELTKDQVKRVNYFINELSAEEKSNYFLTLKNKALNEPDFKAVIAKLNGLGFFDSQAEYLKELTK